MGDPCRRDVAGTQTLQGPAPVSLYSKPEMILSFPRLPKMHRQVLLPQGFQAVVQGNRSSYTAEKLDFIVQHFPRSLFPATEI